MPRRICVITTGHLAACPRMLKAADAFVEAGYDVHVVMIRSGGWAAEADARLCAARSWRARIVSYDKSTDPARWAWTGVRQRAAGALLASVPRTPARLGSLTCALSRVGPEIVRVARALRADFYYAGAAGALGLAALAADGRAPWAVDVEDAHGLEPLESGDESLARRMWDLESTVVHDAAFVTAAGEGVASYYRRRHGVRPLVINNVFRLGPAPVEQPPGPLSVYWFSQTIGPRRGLEALVDSLGRANVALELTLRGRPDGPFVDALRARTADVAPKVELRIEPPADPDAMVELASTHHVGVSFEDEAIPHRAVCTPNKLFVYLAAGLAIAASPTPGQRPVLASARPAVAVFDRRDSRAFESAIRQWAAHPGALHRARFAAWRAAAERWRWDHACERDALVRRVNEVLR